VVWGFDDDFNKYIDKYDYDYEYVNKYDYDYDYEYVNKYVYYYYLVG